MAQVVALCSLLVVEEHHHGGDEVDDLAGGQQIHVGPAVTTPVPIAGQQGQGAERGEKRRNGGGRGGQGGARKYGRVDKAAFGLGPPTQTQFVPKSEEPSSLISPYRLRAEVCVSHPAPIPPPWQSAKKIPGD